MKTKHARINALKVNATDKKRRWLDALFDTVPKIAAPYIFSSTSSRLKWVIHPCVRINWAM
jgi:hypothetical protein